MLKSSLARAKSEVVFSLSGRSPLAQVAKNLRMGFEDIMQLLSRHVQSNTPDLWETACAWAFGRTR